MGPESHGDDDSRTPSRTACGGARGFIEGLGDKATDVVGISLLDVVEASMSEARLRITCITTNFTICLIYCRFARLCSSVLMSLDAEACEIKSKPRYFNIETCNMRS